MKKSSLVVALLLGASAPAHATKDRIVPLSPAAAQAIERVRKAIEAHDFATLEQLMAPRFLYGAVTRSAADVVAEWKREPKELDGATGLLGACHPERDGIVYCPHDRGLLNPDEGPTPELRFEQRGGRWIWTTWHPN